MWAPLVERTRKQASNWEAPATKHVWGRGQALGHASEDAKDARAQEREYAVAFAAWEHSVEVREAMKLCRKQLHAAENNGDTKRAELLKSTVTDLERLFAACRAFNASAFLGEWSEFRPLALQRRDAKAAQTHTRVFAADLVADNEFMTPTYRVSTLVALAQPSAASASSKSAPFFEWTDVADSAGVPGVFLCVYLKDGTKVIRLRDVLRYFSVDEPTLALLIARWESGARGTRGTDVGITTDPELCACASPKLHPATKFVGAVWVPRIAMALHVWYAPSMAGFAAVAKSKGMAQVRATPSPPPAMEVPGTATESQQEAPDATKSKQKNKKQGSELLDELLAVRAAPKERVTEHRPLRRSLPVLKEIPVHVPDYLPPDLKQAEGAAEHTAERKLSEPAPEQPPHPAPEQPPQPAQLPEQAPIAKTAAAPRASKRPADDPAPTPQARRSAPAHSASPPPPKTKKSPATQRAPVEAVHTTTRSGRVSSRRPASYAE